MRFDVIGAAEWLYDRASRYPKISIACAGLLFLSTISLIDLLAPGSVIIPDHSSRRQGELELATVIDQMQADRAMLARFEYSENGDRERVAVALASAGGAEKVTKANRRVSLQAQHYEDLYHAHLRRECWSYRTQHNGESSALEVGMLAVGAEVLVSCPLFRRSNSLSERPWGALSLSWDTPLIDEERAMAELKKLIVGH